MRKLEEQIELKGLGQPTVAKQIKRQGKVCMYLRDDGVVEVFKVKIAKATVLKGIEYPDREIYPNNEDFGVSAWCFHGEDAKVKGGKKFEQLLIKNHRAK